MCTVDALLRNVRQRDVELAGRGERVEHHLEILILEVERHGGGAFFVVSGFAG